METVTPASPAGSAAGRVVTSLAEALAINAEREALGLPPLRIVQVGVDKAEGLDRTVISAVPVSVGYQSNFVPHVPSRRGGGTRALSRQLASLTPVVPALAGRNDPCPCGSGLKYKKCHRGKPIPDKGA